MQWSEEDVGIVLKATGFEDTFNGEGFRENHGPNLFDGGFAIGCGFGVFEGLEDS